MKDFLSLFGFVTGNRYNAVSTNSNNVYNETAERNTTSQPRRNSRRCSSVVVNRFFAETVHLEKRKRSRCAVFLMLTGVLAIVAGCYILFGKPYDRVFKWKISFSEGGETFELWRKPPVELLLKAYLFNVTNRDAFLEGKEKLRVEEVGPYVYREIMEHSNVSFNDNGTLTNIPRHPLFFAAEYSNGTEEDILILPNIALLSIANVVKDKSFFTQMGLNLLIRQTNSQPLVEMTAREFMFGYQTTLTTLGNAVLTSWIYFDKIGLVDRMYDFDGDVSTVYTGENDVRLSGVFDTYRGSKNLPQWFKGEECDNVSRVSGTSDASKFPSLIQPEDRLIMFRKSLCRTMPMMKTGETVVGGLKAYNYTWEEGILDNGLHNPENKCFCRDGYCLPEGLLDVADCYYGFPIALSYPHFYKADPSLIAAVEGSHPEQDKHETKFVIQPESGLPLSLAVRMQINMAFGDLSAIRNVERFSNMVLPMMWTEIGMAELPQHLKSKFYLYLNIIPVILDVALYISLICGPLLLVGSIIRVFWMTWMERRSIDCESNGDFSKKHMNYINDDKMASIKAKEMDVYFSSLLMPIPAGETHHSIVRANASDEDIV